MAQCLRAIRDDRVPYQQPVQGQATLFVPPQLLALPAPPRQQQQQPQSQGQQHQWQPRQQQRQQQQPNRSQMARRAYAIN